MDLKQNLRELSTCFDVVKT